MKNTHASEAPFITWGTESFAATDAPGRPGAWHGRRNLVLGLAAVSLVAVTVGGAKYARVSTHSPVVAHASELTEGVAATGAYQRDGSVFTEQVPSAASANLPAYGPGGSVYTAQVPSAG